MINITAIDHVVFRVVDLEKVATFYIDVLGARWEKKQEAIGLYQLRIGTSLVDLVPVDGKLGSAGGAPCVYRLSARPRRVSAINTLLRADRAIRP